MRKQEKGNDYDAKITDNNSAQNNKHPVYNRTAINTKTIQLKASNGKYVCADGSLNYIVIANRDTAQGWETFTLLLFEKNECAIVAYNNQFFCAELDLRTEIAATRINIGNWETFSLMEIDSNHVAFKAANGKYLSLDEKNLQLYARTESIGKQEKFEMVIK